jgi:hypothetical protein
MKQNMPEVNWPVGLMRSYFWPRFRHANRISLESAILPAAPVTMVPAMPMMVMAPAMPPSHFRGRRPGILLNRRRGAGVADRQRLRTLGRSGEDEQCADRSKAQNFRHLHI